jgi:hypothetical protein
MEPGWRGLRLNGGGPAGAARGARSFLTETISRLLHAGATGQLTVRADSAFCSRAVLTTARTFGVRFSITARQDKKVRATIESIPESAWRPIPYWLSTSEVSGTDVAETSYTCVAHARDAITVRLVVRRVRPTPGSQLALFTDGDFPAADVGGHRPAGRPTGGRGRSPPSRRRGAVGRRAQIGRSGAPALGTIHGQRRRLALVVTAHNLGRAVGALAGINRATTATLRRRPCTIPGRLVHTADGARLPPRRPPAGCTCDYRPVGLGPTRSSPPWAASTPSRCAAEQPGLSATAGKTSEKPADRQLDHAQTTSGRTAHTPNVIDHQLGKAVHPGLDLSAPGQGLRRCLARRFATALGALSAQRARLIKIESDGG